MSTEALLKRQFKSAARGPLIKCPTSFCTKSYPITYATCPFCGLENTIESGISAAAEPLVNKVQKAITTAGAETKKKVQKVYLIISLLVLFAVFSGAGHGDAADMAGCAVLSVVYLGLILVLVRWFVPRDKIIKFLLKTTWVVKLSLIFNYLTCLLALQNIIGDWWGQFAALAGVVCITWAGLWIFCCVFWPVATDASSVLLGGLSGKFNPTDNQGRKGFWDRY
jgi:hypothetical protein